MPRRMRRRLVSQWSGALARQTVMALTSTESDDWLQIFGALEEGILTGSVFENGDPTVLIEGRKVDDGSSEYFDDARRRR